MFKNGIGRFDFPTSSSTDTRNSIKKIKEIKDDDITIIEVLVSNDDIKYVIGKNGVTANSIRTIVQASSYVNNLGKVKINIDSL